MANKNEQQRKLRSTEKNIAPLSPYCSSPSASLSQAKLWETIETRLDSLKKDLTDSIISQLKTEIKALTISLSERISSIENEFKQKINALEQGFTKRYGTINNSVFTLQSRVDTVESHCNRLYEIENELLAVKSQITENNTTELQMQIDALARKNIAGDVVMHGIPISKDENLLEIFHKLCTKVNLPTVTPNSIIRTTPAKNSSCSAITIKLPHAQNKINLLKKMAEYYKTNSKLVTLNDLGFASNKFVRVYECLTKQNHAIFRKANELRSNHCLHSVFTRNGKVFVRELAGSTATYIPNILSLDCLRTSSARRNAPTTDANTTTVADINTTDDTAAGEPNLGD